MMKMTILMMITTMMMTLMMIILVMITMTMTLSMTMTITTMTMTTMMTMMMTMLELSLVKDTTCSVQYGVKTVTFSSVHHLSLYFPSNFGADQTKIFYIGLAGEFTQVNRVGVVNAVYEARPMMEDHKSEEKEKMFGGSGPAF